MQRRALHFVFKVGKRQKTIDFYRNVLGMKVLRHEEFEEGCKASCNGPYDGKWSKTMIGYGKEDDNFVIELTYNYGLKSYANGNDFKSISVSSGVILSRALVAGMPVENDSLVDPDGHTFCVAKNGSSSGKVTSVTLAISDLAKSIEYWNGLLGMRIVSQSEDSCALTYDDVTQCSLQLVQSNEPIERAEAYGRIAFACPSSQLKEIESSVMAANHTVLTPYVSLDTPGKATVEVVILADPDGHEICFVCDEGFRDLSQVDPQGDKLLNDAMEADKSEEWFAKKAARQEAKQS